MGYKAEEEKESPPKKINNFFIKSLIQLNLLENPAITNLHKSCLKENGKFF